MQLTKNAKARRASKRTRLEAYFATSFGLFGVLSSAEAGVITITLSDQDKWVNGGAMPGGYRNIDNWASTGQSLGLYNAYYVTGGGPTWAVYGGGNKIQVSNVFFSAGEAIGPNTPDSVFLTYGGRLKNNSFTAPDTGTSKFFGFRTTTNSFANPVEWSYGWIELTWDGNASEFYLKAAAYQSDSGTPILAGNTGGGEVPEPASGAIAALLLGGSALRRWRKQKREASAEGITS